MRPTALKVAVLGVPPPAVGPVVDSAQPGFVAARGVRREVRAHARHEGGDLLLLRRDRDRKSRGFWSDVSVLTGDLDRDERVERAGASLGGARVAAVVQGWANVKRRVANNPGETRGFFVT